MISNIKFTEHFRKEYKRLAKKYASLKADVLALTEELKKNPKSGKHLGNDTYKIRMAITSKGKGKRGGARVITYFLCKDNTVYMLSIYDKSEDVNISDGEIKKILKEVDSETSP